MKDRRNWKIWLLPGVVFVALTAIMAFTAASARIDAHIETEAIHKDVETLDERYMPREVLNEKLDNIQNTVKRIEQKLGD